MTKTNALAAFTCAAGSQSSEDVGRTVTGTGIAAGASIATVNATGSVGTAPVVVASTK